MSDGSPFTVIANDGNLLPAPVVVKNFWQSVAERHDVPVVRMNLLVDAGYASDQLAAPGTARLAGDMMDLPHEEFWVLLLNRAHHVVKKKRISEGGVSGTVADPTDQQPDTVALRAITAKVRDDARVEACLLSIGDGVLLARKL